MKKFNWAEFIINAIVFIGMAYILYFGFRFLYHAWAV